MSIIDKPSVTVNGDTILIKPGTLKMKEGYATVTTTVQSAGGNNLEYLTSEDLTTQKGEIIFEMVTTSDNITKKATWQDLPGSNTVQAIDSKTGLSRSLKFGSIEEDPEMTTGSEGMFEVKFTGAKLV